ncbi:MAG: SAVED domain-containing protein [Thermoleophilia bacterium]
MIRKLFLSHYSAHAADVRRLAVALRLRGLVPWVDKDGGFRIADDSEEEVRRALRDDCFGLALWATADVFARPFIREIELPEACRLNSLNPDFLLFAIPVGMSFEDLRALSVESLGTDLSRFHSIPVGNPESLPYVVDEVSRQALGKILEGQSPTTVSMQVSTRERMPSGAKESLFVDACDLFLETASSPSSWNMVLEGLRDVKSTISRLFGRPRLHISGSKHLSAAFMIGRVFAPFDLEVRQTATEIWESDCSPVDYVPFEVCVEKSGVDSGVLVVEVASGRKNVKAGVDAYFSGMRVPWANRISLRPEEPLRVDNGLCVTMAEQAHAEIERVVVAGEVSEIHLFSAAPGSFMVFLGRLFRGMPPVTVYEWEDGQYKPAAALPPGVL